MGKQPRMARVFGFGRRGPRLSPTFLLLAAAVVIFVIAIFDKEDQDTLIPLGLACFAGSFVL